MKISIYHFYFRAHKHVKLPSADHRKRDKIGCNHIKNPKVTLLVRKERKKIGSNAKNVMLYFSRGASKKMYHFFFYRYNSAINLKKVKSVFIN